MQRKFLLGASLAAIVLPLACASTPAGASFCHPFSSIKATPYVPHGSTTAHRTAATTVHAGTASHSQVAYHRPGIDRVHLAAGNGAVGVTTSGSGGSQPNTTVVGYSESHAPPAGSQTIVATDGGSDAIQLTCPAKARVELHIDEANWPLQVFVNGKLAGTVNRDATPTTLDLTSFAGAGNTSVELAARRMEDESNLRGYLDCDGQQTSISDADATGRLYRQAYLLRR